MKRVAWGAVKRSSKAKKRRCAVCGRTGAATAMRRWRDLFYCRDCCGEVAT